MSKQPVIYYVVTLEQGEHWNARFPMRQQQHWDEHARLMDAFVDDGFIILGGTLDGEERILLVINAERRQAIEARFAAAPGLQGGYGASPKLSAGKSSWMLDGNEYMTMRARVRGILFDRSG